MSTPKATHVPRESVDARVAMLRSEMEAASDRGHKAALQFEIGHITETELAQEAQAVREYLGAYNADPTFQPPLAALVRIFERRRSFKNLARLYEAEAKSAATPEERASSIVDRATLSEDHLAQPAAALWEQAIAEHPEGAALPALMLERLLLSTGDRAGAIAAIAIRAEHVKEPALKGMLLLELARAREEQGDVDGALEAARQAATLPAGRFRFLEQLERLARRHGRAPEIVAALEGRAALAARSARGEETAQASGAFSVQRFADEARASAAAAALYREAARVRMAQLGDPQGALAALGKAIQLRGADDLALVRDRMLACELAGELGGAADDARRLLAALAESDVPGGVGRHAAPLHFRIAEEAQSRGDVEGARIALEAAMAADPGSAVVAAMLEDLSLAGAQPGDGRIEGWIARLSARADQVEGEEKIRLAWRAAHLAATRLGDGDGAAVLYAAALSASGLAAGSASGSEPASTPAMIAREWLGASLRLGHAVGARDAARALASSGLTSSRLASDGVDDDERSAALRDLHELERMVLDDSEAADAVLDEALRTPAAGWAADLARLHAASSGDFALLARAHRMLAQRTTDPEAGAAHLCGAARALARKGELDEAIVVLREAMERVPGHRYAVALLEEVYRSRGDADAVVKLLRDAAEADRQGKGEAQLLLAGAAAEAAGDHAVATSTYEEAADRDPSAIGPLFALRRLAESRGDEALLLRVLERLSELETSHGTTGRATLELGEHWHIVAGKPELAEAPLRMALAVPDFAAPAALDLALIGPRAPIALVDGTRELAARAEGAAKAGLLRELGGIALDLTGDAAGAESIANEVLALDDDDAWALVTKLRVTWRDASRAQDRADALLALADGTSDPQVSAELVVHGLRAAAFAGSASDDAVIRASDLDASVPGSFAAAVAGLEALGEADDPGERADALARWIEHASDVSALSMRAARGRALTSAGRGAEAVEVLRAVLASFPDDLASWEALRVAARDAEQWTHVVAACDRLVSVLDGDLRAELLEEGAAVLMDQLESDDEAERRLREALELDGTRVIAYGRLHDLLAERGDDRGLLALVQARADRTDDPDLLTPLFYELARLHRSLADRELALQALDNLLMLEPEHVGGLALLVELQVQREAWAEAVSALRTLAAAKDVPASQRRIARLGAADFLEKKLNQPAAALEELAAIDVLGLADRGLYERMADLGERAVKIDAAVAALAKASAAAKEPDRRASIERRAARLLDERLGDEDGAIAAYRRALVAVPTDVLAGEALTKLLDVSKRVEHARAFEVSVRAALEPDPTEPTLLRALATCARWRGDKALATSVLGVLAAIGAADEEELESLSENTEVLRRLGPSTRVLSDARLAEIRVAGLDGPAWELAQLATETLIEIDRLEPSTFGLGRGDVVNPKAPPAIAQEITGIAGLLGAPAGDLWVGGKDPQLFAVIPSYKGKPAWLAGSGVAAPLALLRRYEAGRWAIALRLGLGCLVARGADGAATSLFAIASAAGAPLVVGEGRAGMADATRAATKAISRRVRKGVPEIAQRMSDGGRSVIAMTTAAHRTFARAGLIIAGDLPSVLELVLGARPDRDRVLASEAALDLVRFWISPSALAARRELGLAT